MGAESHERDRTACGCWVTTGAALRAARLAAHMAQGQMAKALDVTPSFISDVERGKREFPRDYFLRLPPAVRLGFIPVVRAALENELAWLEAIEAEPELA